MAEELEHEDEFLPPAAQKGKKNLEIEIDENEDYEAQNNQAQMNLNDKLMKMEHENFEEVEEIVEADLIEEFDALYQADPELQQILGEYPERYTIEEKLSII